MSFNLKCYGYRAGNKINYTSYTPSSQHVFNVRYFTRWEEPYPMSHGSFRVCSCDPVVFTLTPAACPAEPSPCLAVLWSCCPSEAQLVSHTDSSGHGISDINLSCPKGDREANQLNGKGVKLPYQNFSRHALLKHRNEIKNLNCDVEALFIFLLVLDI